jgi:hypothetical protein
MSGMSRALNRGRAKARARMEEKQNSAKARVEKKALNIDGGLGMSAVAAVAACAPGPARELEIARWVARAKRRGGTIVTPMWPGMSEAEFLAVKDMTAALAEIREGLPEAVLFT